MLSPLVVLDNVKKTYLSGNAPVHALRSTALTIHSGEFVSIMGPSGSGKSTLLHIIGCLDRATEGSYLFNKQNIFALSDTQLALLRALQIGFIFQSFNLIPQLTVFENIEIPFHYQSNPLPTSEMHARIFRSIEQVQLTHRLFHFPSQLSGGELQRAAIARALSIQPLVILADEPTGNLDSETGKTIMQIFKDLHAEGTTVILVTHDEKVAAYSERTITMQDGQMITDRLRE